MLDNTISYWLYAAAWRPGAEDEAALRAAPRVTSLASQKRNYSDDNDHGHSIVVIISLFTTVLSNITYPGQST